MSRRVFAIASLIVGASLYVWAAEHATFVLTDGQRKSGAVVAHGGRGNNLIDDNFNLAVDGGREESFPFSQVAVIDFVGGQPPAAELLALPSDLSHILTLRSGAVLPGRFINMRNGQTVVWQNSAGQEQELPIGQVSRIYLNPQSARMVYGVGNEPQPAAVGTAGTTPAGSIRVDGNIPWVDSGMYVRRGDRIAFNATGDVNSAPGASGGPAGSPVLHGNYPVSSASAGALIGRVGNGAPFYIGSNTQAITMPVNGPLMLGINDDYFADNSGFFNVTITRQ